MAPRRIGGIIQVEKSVLELKVSDRALKLSKGSMSLASNSARSVDDPKISSIFSH
jgi:hypothetical protein